MNVAAEQIMKQIWGDDWCSTEECRIKSCKNAGLWKIHIITDFDYALENIVLCDEHITKYLRLYEDWKRLDTITNSIIGRNQMGVRWTWSEIRLINHENQRVLHNVQRMGLNIRGQFLNGIARYVGGDSAVEQRLVYDLETDMRVREDNLECLEEYFNSADHILTPISERLEEFFNDIRKSVNESYVM